MALELFSVTDSSYLDAYSTSRSVDGIGSLHYVFLNTTKSSERIRMDVAHELGHLVLHGKGGAHGVVAEKEAGTFASAFLMPRTSIMAGVPHNPMLEELLTLKSRMDGLAHRARLPLERVRDAQRLVCPPAIHLHRAAGV